MSDEPKFDRLATHAAERFFALLSRTTSSALPSMLSARARWQLVVDVLLGQAPMRGGRSRDFPFSDDRVESCRLAIDLSALSTSFAPGRGPRRLTVRAFDIVLALRLWHVSQGVPAAEGLDVERHYTAALQALLDLLFQPREAAQVRDALGLRLEVLSFSLNRISPAGLYRIG